MSQPVKEAPPVLVHPLLQDTTGVLGKRIATLEVSEDGLRSQLNAMGQQVTTMSGNIDNLNSQIANLNQAVNALTTQMAKQSEELNALIAARARPKATRKPAMHRIIPKPIAYYIQAVIPGRAWLIGSNGSTLTVREGTNIAGYGTVKLIDSIQGKIITSSGRTIRFSQEDS